MGRKKSRKNKSRETETLRADRNSKAALLTEAGSTERKDITEEAWNKERDIYSRLTYPLVDSFGGQEDEGDDEETIELNFSPRIVFASNLCLICMKGSQVVCESCEMVSYCSKNHQNQGWSRHRDLCKPLSQIRLARTAMEAGSELTAEEYRVYRLKLIEILESEIRRPLELWEREIVLYPRVCRFCRDFSRKLACCAHCGIEFICKDHADRHKERCREFKVFRRCLFMQQRHGHVVPKIPNTRQVTPLRLSSDTFDSLIFRVYGPSSYYSQMDCHTYSTLSYLCTIPLTALYAMEICSSDWETRTDLTLHVVGAELQFEGINLYVWEKMFLHFLPKLKKLSLTFVGPELRIPSCVPVDLLTKVSACSACVADKRAVGVSFYPEKCYHDVITVIGKPDLVCLFNPGLYRRTAFQGRDTWPETIRAFCKTEVPVVVTSYTADEIPREIVRIKSISGIEVLLEPRRNPFASIKPDRNFVSDDTAPLIYKNYYLTVVKGNSAVAS